MDDDHNHSNLEDSDDEENETLEESPCSRWLKRKERVSQCQVPGVDATFLAMDDDEGVEVVWSEINFDIGDLSLLESKEDTFCDIFDHLVQIDHPNIVKMHKFWIRKPADNDSPNISPRICIITEYTSSGTLKHFLQRTKKQMKLEAWKKWCTQMLSALCYLHACQPQIIHGNLSCDTNFISYNGLIKIGALAPDSIHRALKTRRNESRSNVHFLAPECRGDSPNRNLTPAADVYSFGMCALQMAALEIATDEVNNENVITESSIQRTIDSLENPLQRDLIRKCLRKDPLDRPTPCTLLFHEIIYEVPSLRLFCANSILNSSALYNLSPEQVNEEHILKVIGVPSENGRVLVELKCSADEGANITLKRFKNTDFRKSDLDKFLEDVKNGGCPLTAVISTLRQPLISKRSRTLSPETMEEGRRITTPDNPYDEETRRLVHVNCTLQNTLIDTQHHKNIMKIIVKLDDKINRQLTSELINENFDPISVSQELVYYGFINKDDNSVMMDVLIDALNRLQPGGTVNCERIVEVKKNEVNGYMPAQVAMMPTQQMAPMTNMITGAPGQVETGQLMQQTALSNMMHSTSAMALSPEMLPPGVAQQMSPPQQTNVILPQVPLMATAAPIYQEMNAYQTGPTMYATHQHHAQTGQPMLVQMVSQHGQGQPTNVVYVQQQPQDQSSMLGGSGQPQMVQFQSVGPQQGMHQPGQPMQFVPTLQQNVTYTARPDLPSLYPVNSFVIPQQAPPQQLTAPNGQTTGGISSPFYTTDPQNTLYGNPMNP